MRLAIPAKPEVIRRWAEAMSISPGRGKIHVASP